MNEMYTECRAALLRLAEEWTDWILDLETGPRAVNHTVSVQIVTSAARYFSHPLLTFDQLTQDMSTLAACVSNLDRWVNHGTWDGEDDDALAGRSDEERTEFLTGEIDWYLFRLLFALDPCTDCYRERSFEDWKGRLDHQLRCAEHLATYRLKREQIIDSRPLHAVQS